MPLKRLCPDYGTPGHPNMDPYYLSPAEERMLEREHHEQVDALREAVEAAIADNRADLWAAEVRVIVGKILADLPQTPGEHVPLGPTECKGAAPSLEAAPSG